ncbi:MAG: hypothetical protein HQL25_03285 [Candidatus Omnitrophica bacterium]|nr:hypothetical protein [Candidatus Omnitrophota bacterium]
MNIWIRYFFIVFALLYAPLVHADNFKADCKNSDVNLASYKEISVAMIDLRGIEISTQNDETNDFEKDTLRPEVFELVAQVVNHHISAKLKLAMMDVVEDEKMFKDKSKALIVNIALKGSFRSQPQRALMRMINANSNQVYDPSDLIIEVEVRDASTKQIILSMSDVQPLALKMYADPFNNDLDQKSLGLILDIWGDKIAGLIASKRK